MGKRDVSRRAFLQGVSASAVTLRFGSLALPLVVGSSACSRARKPPNVLVILGDDVGFGDLSCNNPDGGIKTPQLDRLAREGMRFTDAHANAAQCTPTRYGLLTGRYAWRTRLQEGVLPHFARPLIDQGRMTLASLLKEAGYATAGFGKWHLGLGWQAKDGMSFDPDSWAEKQVDLIDFAKPLTVSPLNYGFDYYFGLGSSNNMLPYCYIENNRVVQVPTKLKFPVYDTESEVGLVSPDYVSEEIDQKLYSKARDWMDRHFETNPQQPFFMYYASSAIHRPCLATEPFRNSSEAGLRGNKMVEFDDIVGRLMRDLDSHGAAENTLVIFTSDNGPRPGDLEKVLKEYAANDWGKPYEPSQLLAVANPAVYQAGEKTNKWYTYGHRAAGIYSGYKSDIYEGGHRVPFLVRWPGVISAGAVTNETVCLTDVLATLAETVGRNLPNNAGEDSVSFLPVLQGKKLGGPLHEALVLDSWYGVKAVRQGRWILILGNDSGGLERSGEKSETPGQLYDLESDPKERENLWKQHPEIVSKLTALADRYEKEGRSVPPRNP